VFDAIGAFSTAGYFNRDKTVGDDITIFGSGLKAVSQVVFADHDNVNADTLSISLPSPGITVADNQIAIDTSTFQIGNATDTDVNSSYRILKLTSARSNATLPLAQRFYVGAPPILTALSGIGVEGNYTRDSETITLEGSGFGHATSLEIVDAQGNLITGIPGLISGIDGTGGTGLTINNATGITVSPNPTGWVNVGYLLDNAVSLSRRVKLTTPFGTVVSSTTAGTGAFTVSATPEFMGSIQATFAGGGYTADDTADATDTNGTYDRSEGDLVINGKNFRGLTTIEFYSGAGVSDGNFTIDPLNPPAGIAMNPDGTQIVIASTTVPTAWTSGGTNNNATVNLVSVAGQSTGNSTISSTVTPIQAQD
jgi:hypothetical protein